MEYLASASHRLLFTELPLSCYIKSMKTETKYAVWVLHQVEIVFFAILDLEKQSETAWSCVQPI